jgi:hypothetical protein
LVSIPLRWRSQELDMDMSKKVKQSAPVSVQYLDVQ